MEKRTEEIVNIAKELPEWFTQKAIENIKKDCINLKVLTEEQSNHILGFIIYSIKGKKCYIKWIAIKKEVQRKGIGHKLIKNLADICKKKNINFIETDTLADTENYAPY